jgi:hypothetical protein
MIPRWVGKLTNQYERLERSTKVITGALAALGILLAVIAWLDLYLRSYIDGQIERRSAFHEAILEGKLAYENRQSQHAIDRFHYAFRIGRDSNFGWERMQAAVDPLIVAIIENVDHEEYADKFAEVQETTSPRHSGGLTDALALVE